MPPLQRTLPHLEKIAFRLLVTRIDVWTDLIWQGAGKAMELKDAVSSSLRPGRLLHFWVEVRLLLHFGK